MLLLPPVPPVDVLIPEHVTVTAGQTRSVSAIVTNRGADALKNVVLRVGPAEESLGLQLPAACSTDGCLVGDLGAGASRTLTFTLTPAGRPAKSTFAVTAGGPDGVLAREYPVTVGSASPAAATGPDVGVTEAIAIGGAFSGRSGDRAKARIGVRNFGAVAGTASVRVTIPDGVRLTAVDDDCLPTTPGILDLATAGTVGGTDYLCFVLTRLNPGAQHLFTFTGEIIRSTREPGSVLVQDTGTSAALIAGEAGGGIPTGWVALGGALPLIAALLVRRRRGKASPRTYAAASPIPIQVVPWDAGESTRAPAATRTPRQGAAPPDIVSFGPPRRTPRPRRKS